MTAGARLRRVLCVRFRVWWESLPNAERDRRWREIEAENDAAIRAGREFWARCTDDELERARVKPEAADFERFEFGPYDADGVPFLAFARPRTTPVKPEETA